MRKSYFGNRSSFFILIKKIYNIKTIACIIVLRNIIVGGRDHDEI